MFKMRLVHMSEIGADDCVKKLLKGTHLLFVKRQNGTEVVLQLPNEVDITNVRAVSDYVNSVFVLPDNPKVDDIDEISLSLD